MKSDEKLLEVVEVKKYYPISTGLFSQVSQYLKAVDGVSFSVYRGETLGLVGESGCGKTTLGKVILRLKKATGGQIIYKGQDILRAKGKEMRRLRSEMQIVFQDPYASLNPRMNVEDIISEPLGNYGTMGAADKKKRVGELLEIVGLSPYHSRRYPHEFSGGQRQRIGIARALALNPELIVCDEPVSALDVSIQSQILNLLRDLQEEFGLTYIFIAHGLAAVKYISDRVGVMYLGKMMELASGGEIFANPRHPYTQALMSAIPTADPRVKKERIILEGDVPSPVDPPKGCRFHTRCRYAEAVCREKEPEFRDIGKGHLIACHRQEQLN